MAVEFHSGTVQFRDMDRNLHDIRAAAFDGLREQISGHLRRRGGDWRLVLRRTGGTMYFDGMLDSLIRWARDEELNCCGDSRTAGLSPCCRPDDWTWVLVRAVPHDEGLMQFDSLFEVTTYPCDLLQGPGTIADAMGWPERELPQADMVEVLNRLFLIQYRGDRLYLSRCPEIALSLDDADREGIWYLIRADRPVDAFAHVRMVLVGGSACSATGPCRQCAVTTVRTGMWDEVKALLATEHPSLEPRKVPDARVSSAMRLPRYYQILGGGN